VSHVNGRNGELLLDGADFCAQRHADFASSAESGSSSSSTAGRIANARASATRCCWPQRVDTGSGRQTRHVDELEHLVHTLLDFLGRLFGELESKADIAPTVMLGKSA